MADEKHLSILMQGVEVWNKWREENPNILPRLRESDLSNLDLQNVNLSNSDLSYSDFNNCNLSNADLRKADLSYADMSNFDFNYSRFRDSNYNEELLEETNLSNANMEEANLRNSNMEFVNLSGANLHKAVLDSACLRFAILTNADLSEARLIGTDFTEADLADANLSYANLFGASFNEATLSNANFYCADLQDADLTETDLSNSDLRNAKLNNCKLVETKLQGCNLSGCKIYGISVWNVETNENTKQSNLIITRFDEPTITVDNLEIAQFIYLLLNNQKVRDVINTITSKVVLILGRFTLERKAVLDAIREELSKYDYLPIIFDFDKPTNRELTETVSTLAHMSKFIIADLTDPSSIPAELCSIIPHLTSVPVVSIIQEDKRAFSMFESFKPYPWVLNTVSYRDSNELIKSIEEKIITPAEKKLKELLVK